MLAIGEIVAVHGLHGQVRVMPLTDFPERFRLLDVVSLSRPERLAAQFRIRSVDWRSGKRQLLLTFQGIRNRAQAAALVGAFIEIEDHQAVELPEDTYFEHDIIGLSVVTTDGRDLGKVTEVLRTGANDVYVTPQGLIPAIGDVVQDIDLAAGTMTIIAVPGLLDE